MNTPSNLNTAFASAPSGQGAPSNTLSIDFPTQITKEGKVEAGFEGTVGGLKILSLRGEGINYLGLIPDSGDGEKVLHIGSWMPANQGGLPPGGARVCLTPNIKSRICTFQIYVVDKLTYVMFFDGSNNLKTIRLETSNGPGYYDVVYSGDGFTHVDVETHHWGSIKSMSFRS
jgi:hypothetical protein